jgi:hypothetical protein
MRSDATTRCAATRRVRWCRRWRRLRAGAWLGFGWSVQELRASISDSDEMVARWLRGFSREGRGKGGLFIAGRGVRVRVGCGESDGGGRRRVRGGLPVESLQLTSGPRLSVPRRIGRVSIRAQLLAGLGRSFWPRPNRCLPAFSLFLISFSFFFFCFSYFRSYLLHISNKSIQTSS